MDQQAHRKKKGSKGGRPPAFDVEAYTKRNAVERGYARLKQWRGIATRYDCEDERVPSDRRFDPRYDRPLVPCV